MRTGLHAVAAATALSFAVPANAAIVVTEYEVRGYTDIFVSGVGDIPDGQFHGLLFLNYDTDTAAYTFNDLQLNYTGDFDWNLQVADLAPSGNEYVLFGTLSGLGLTLGSDDFYFTFDPNVLDQGVPLYHSSSEPSSRHSLFTTGVEITRLSDAVPEPSTWAMMLMGFGGLGVATRRRRARALVRLT